MQQAREVLSGEFPLEGLGDLFIVFLKVENPLCQGGKGREVIGREQFSLEDGEIDFDLVQPAGMDGEMDDNNLRPLALKAPDRGGKTRCRESRRPFGQSSTAHRP